jgi:hypothetical protein
MIIDLTSGDSYFCSLSVENLPPHIDFQETKGRMCMSAFAILAARIPEQIRLSTMLNTFSNDCLLLRDFFQEFLDAGLSLRRGQRLKMRQSMRNGELEESRSQIPLEVLRDLDQCEQNYPSTGPFSRTENFHCLTAHLRRSGVSSRHVAYKAINHMKEQNRFIDVVSSEVEEWCKRFTPDPFHKFCLQLLVLTEIFFVSGPVPALREEVVSTCLTICPSIVSRQLIRAKIIAPGVADRPDEERSEIDYWNDRLAGITLRKAGGGSSGRSLFGASSRSITLTRGSDRWGGSSAVKSDSDESAQSEAKLS